MASDPVESNSVRPFRAAEILRSRSFKYRLPILVAMTAIAVWAYWPAVAGIFEAWISNPDYTHGFFVIPISIWLLWARRGHAPREAASLDLRAFVLLAAAGAVRLLAGRFYLPQLDAWSIPLWVGGLVWLFFGWSYLRWALPSIAFLWFATPLPGTIEILLSTPLQRFAAQVSAHVLRIIGQPALVEGTTVLLDDHVLDVERACSGLRMFYGIFALAVACVAIARPARWKAILVLAAAAPVAIVANVARIVITALLMKYASSEAAQKFSHDLAGVVMIPLAVGLFFVLLLVVNRITTRLKAENSGMWLMRWALVCIVLLCGVFLWSRRQETLAATTLRDTATRFETAQNWPKAVQYLSRYVRAVPDDTDALIHLAELYQTHASGSAEYLRASELFQKAWRASPSNEALAKNAIQCALQAQDYQQCILLCEELIKITKDEQTRNDAIKQRGDALYAYLQSEGSRGTYGWEDVRKSLVEAVQLPNFEVRHAEALADVYRQRLTEPDQATRKKLADELMDRVVNDQKNDPLAWLARYHYRTRLDEQVASKDSPAGLDLKRAISLAEQPTSGPEVVPVFIVASTLATQQKNLTLAEDFLKQAVRVAPADYRPYVLLADLKRRSGTEEARAEAVRILREGREKAKSTDLALVLPLASMLVESGDLDGAEAELAPIERIVPYIVGPERGAVALTVGLVRGQITALRDGPQEAAALLRGLLNDIDVRLAEQRIPQVLAQAYAMLGSLYVTLGVPDLASDAFRQAVRIDPANLQWRAQAATIARSTGDFELADRDYRQLIQNGVATPETWAALIGLEIQRQLGRGATARDWRQAREWIDRAAASGTPPNVIKLLSAEIFATDGQLEEAEKTLAELCQEAPEDAMAWRGLAILQGRQEKFDDALQSVLRYMELSQGSIDSTGLRARLLADSGRSDEAVEVLKESLADSKEGTLPPAAAAAARMLNELGKTEESIAVLEEAHQKAPENLFIADSLASMAWSSQDWKRLEKYEDWLKQIEGQNGTLWKAYRAQRLLGTVKSIDDPDFREVVGHVDTIVRERPRWAKGHFLQGEVALRMGHQEAATAAFERAWRFGGRGILLADRLIDLLTQQGRFEEAQAYVTQVREYFSISQGLFDRAIPYMAQEGEGREVIRMAEDWVKREPEDFQARLRLGRLLMVLAESSSAGLKDQYLQRAEEEFRRAIELAPNDVRSWTAAVMFYAQTKGTRDEAVETLRQFAENAEIDDLHREFVSAQLYELIGLATQAQQYYLRTSTLVEEEPDAPHNSQILARMARFYLTRVPLLAGRYARQALALKPDNSDAKLVLLISLTDRSDKESLVEAFRLLDEVSENSSIDAVILRRLQATLLSNRNEPGDLDAAAELLQQSISRGREEKLLLASLYERSERIMPAMELYEGLARSSEARPGELTEYLRFWQQHFVAPSSTLASAGFDDQAKAIYQRLGQLPGQLPERLRWQIRELRVRAADKSLPTQEVMPLLEEIWSAGTAQDSSDESSSALFQRLIQVLLQEKCDEAAAQWVASAPAGIPKAQAAVALCHGFISVPDTSETESIRGGALRDVIAAYPTEVSVLQAAGDYQFMSGRYDEAVKLYRDVLKIDSQHTFGYNNLALALSETPNGIEEAKQKLSHALETDPQNGGLLDTLAVVELIANQPQQALQILQPLEERDPTNAVTHLHLAVVYDRLQEEKRAQKSLTTAIALGVQRAILSRRDLEEFSRMQEKYLKAEMPPAPVHTSTSLVAPTQEALR